MENIKYIKLGDLLPCPYNREIDKAKVVDIKNKIKETGIIKPFVVTEVSSDGGTKIMITDGHHRYLAMKELVDEGKYTLDSEIPTVMAGEKGVETAKDEAPQEVKESLLESLLKINEETKIKRILITSAEGTWPDFHAIKFMVEMQDGKQYSYRAEASPFMIRKFNTLLKARALGKALSFIKPYVMPKEQL